MSTPHTTTASDVNYDSLSHPTTAADTNGLDPTPPPKKKTKFGEEICLVASGNGFDELKDLLNNKHIGFDRSDCLILPSQGVGDPSKELGIVIPIGNHILEYSLGMPQAIAFHSLKGKQDKKNYLIDSKEWIAKVCEIEYFIVIFNKWEWKVYYKDANVITEKIRKRLLDLLNPKKFLMHRQNMQEVDIGVQLMEGYELKKAPWEDALPQQIQEGVRSTRAKANPSWGGRFSIIIPLENDVTIGMLHCSHINFNSPLHLGGVSRIGIPLGCFILFNFQMYHYGDVTGILGCQPLQSVRAFAYLVEQDYPDPGRIETFKAGEFCDGDQCPECKRMREVLAPVVDEENIWHPDPQLLQSAKIGHSVLGNVHSLGWVVVKGSNPHNDFKKWDISRDLSTLVWNDKTNWHKIGNLYTSSSKQQKKPKENDMVVNGIVITKKNLNTREMVHKSLQNDPYNLMAMREIPGTTSCREMKYVRGVDWDFEEKCPILSAMLRCNRVLANVFLRKFTGVQMNYQFFGLNFLRNKNFVLQQYLHRDYEDSRRDS